MNCIDEQVNRSLVPIQNEKKKKIFNALSAKHVFSKAIREYNPHIPISSCFFFYFQGFYYYFGQILYRLAVQ